MRRTVIIIAVIAVLGITFAVAYALRPTRTVTAQMVTINGTDETGALIDPVNVWATYQPRGRVVAHVRNGEQVAMLKREGDGVLIQTRDGTQGWVTYWFIVGQKP